MCFHVSKGLLASSAPFCHALVTLRHSESFCFIISVEISLFFFNFCNNMRKTAVISFVSVWESSLVKSPGSTYFFCKKAFSYSFSVLNRYRII